MGEEENSQTAKKGRLYWLLVNLRHRCVTFIEENSGPLLMFCFGSLPILFVIRSLLHAPIVASFNELYGIGIVFLTIVFLCWLGRECEVLGRIVAAIITVAFCFFTLNYGRELKEYLTLFFLFRSLDVVELDELPISDFERIQPEESVYSLAYEAMTETEAPSRPDFVRIGEDYRWTLAVEPSYPLARLFGSITDVFNLPGTAASPGFQNENRVKVQFQVGEHLLLSHNAKNATIRSLGMFRYFRYEPAEVLFLPDDSGEWVEAVSLIRWKGLFFPSPEFGGVQIIRQGESGFVGAIRRSLFGVGDWVPPSEVNGYPFLAGQSLTSRQVSRVIAQSFRFQDGFFAPFPFYHQGDIRVPDLHVDGIEQPFVGFFRIKGEPGRLYHYFALEPYDPDKQGLNTSLFVPADGTPKVFVYHHSEHKGSLTGVSAISAKIVESRKEYDWERNRPVEHRPFIRQIDGTTHFFWLTTVVTLKQGVRQGDFIAGSVPDVVLTDATFNRPIWVDPLHPATWIDKLRIELSETWASSQKLPNPPAEKEAAAPAVNAQPGPPPEATP